MFPAKPRKKKTKVKLKPKHYRVYKKLTNRHLLRLFKQGHFRVESIEVAGPGPGEIRYEPCVFRQFGCRNRGLRQLTITREIGSSHNGVPRSDGSWYYYVTFYYQGYRKKCALHRILWMVAQQRLVPQSHHLHHRKGKEYNLPIDLELWTAKDHDEFHQALRRKEYEENIVRVATAKRNAAQGGTAQGNGSPPQRTQPPVPNGKAVAGYRRFDDADFDNSVHRQPGEDNEDHHGSESLSVDLAAIPF